MNVPRYAESGVPVAAVAIYFRRDATDWLLLGYRTSEIDNDVYAYSEALYRLVGSAATLERQEHFLLEVAGLESLEWQLLWPLNVGALVFLTAMVRFGQRRMDRRTSIRVASQTQ